MKERRGEERRGEERRGEERSRREVNEQGGTGTYISCIFL